MTIKEPSRAAVSMELETPLGCPQCNSILYEVHGAEPIQFRCRRGHVVSLDEICPGAEFKLRDMLADTLNALMHR